MVSKIFSRCTGCIRYCRPYFKVPKVPLNVVLFARFWYHLILNEKGYWKTVLFRKNALMGGGKRHREQAWYLSFAPETKIQKL